MSIDNFDYSLESENPENTIAIILEFSRVRSAYLVGKALATKYPTEEDWNTALRSREFVEMVEEFSQCVADIRTASEVGPVLTPDTVQKSILQHYGRALEAVKELSQVLAVPGEDMLSVLVNA